RLSPPSFYVCLPLWARPPLPLPLFPYTTLFRSHAGVVLAPLAEPRVIGEHDEPRLGAGKAYRVHQRRHRERCRWKGGADLIAHRSEEHTSELQSRENLVCRLLLEKKNQKDYFRR